MPFLVYFPLGERAPIDVTTTTNVQVQLWQELVRLRHVPAPEGLPERKEPSPWIDQAKAYYLDACRSDWRSAGLLYYYSFLNMAKAYLCAAGRIAKEDLCSVSLYHGLSSEPQASSSITDFNLVVHPPDANGRKNVFSHFWQALTGKDWPFPCPITFPLSDILPYCMHISDELSSLVGVVLALFPVSSLLRIVGKHVWFELLVPAEEVEVVTEAVQDWPLETVPPESWSQQDAEDWHRAFGVMGVRHPLLRSQRFTIGADGTQQLLLGKLMQDAKTHIAPFAFATPTDESPRQRWLFVPHILLQNKRLPWHPLLSEYVVAFVLSTILRYQPHLLHNNDLSVFLAEAWCNQCAVDALRQFLFIFTRPPKRVNT